MLTTDFVAEDPGRKRKPKYKTPALVVARPAKTYITIDQAMIYTGDNSAYSKRCLYILC
jgi:hypothetical protein